MKKENRRDFLRRGAALAAGVFVVPRFAIGKEGASANGKLNVAVIGAGGRGSASFGRMFGGERRRVM